MRKPDSDSDICVGLDIGTSKVCVAVGERVGGKKINILGVGQASSFGVSKGRLYNFLVGAVCVNLAIRDAEEKSRTKIKSVSVAVTGEYIHSCNLQFDEQLNNGGKTICDGDLDDLRATWKLPRFAHPRYDTHGLLHIIPQGYYLDGRGPILNPVGLNTKTIKGDFHFILCGGSMLGSKVHCLSMSIIECNDAVFAALASATAILTKEQKYRGALVLDIGAGTVDYVYYEKGLVWDSGCFGYDGEGSKNLTVIMETLNREMKARKIFPDTTTAAVYITGGASVRPGFAELVQSILKLPTHLASAQELTGSEDIIGNPAFACALGLVKLEAASLAHWKALGYQTHSLDSITEIPRRRVPLSYIDFLA